MVLGKNLTLSQGENSVSLQNQGEINGNVNIGISLSEITDLFEELFSAKLPSLIADAKSESYKAIADFALKFHEKLNLTVNDAIGNSIDEKMEKKFASSEVQSLISEMVNQVGTKNDISLNEILVNLLMDKLSSNNNDYLINQAISYLKYLNKDQVFFLCFIEHLRNVPSVSVQYNGEQFDSDIFSVYQLIRDKITTLELQADLLQKAEDFYKIYINDMSKFFISNISSPVDIDLLALNNMVFSDKSYTMSILQLFGNGLGINDYKAESIKIDFPDFIKFIEFMKIDVSELDELIKPLTPFGKCIVKNCNIKIN
ncbi:LPO_1073/Vpar_1526 family protein [Kingella denitrificans]|uniref:LPO_1073/Vpar_1526 family protein n=1 Tax=Kingella denitrificans TaxID=502 RepID=UPI0028D32F57|nr:LPO_1073/Vpar_1526 family protein [Kingella denitrificans]